MNILVTGGAGYIGSHTCKYLSLKGHRPVTVDSLVRGHRENVLWGPFEKCDLRDESGLTQILRKHKIEAVLHFAAFAYVGESMEKPLEYFENNVAGTLSLLRAMGTCDVRKMIFSSTCSTYGIPEQMPISEQTIQNPINPYGLSKWMVEQVLKDLCRAQKIDAIALRYFNAAGADLDEEVGECHDPEPHLIPNLIRNILNKKLVTIFGKDYPTEDGTCVRDYVHVWDLAEAHWSALEFMNSRKGFFAYNLGTGIGLSNLEMVRNLEQHLNTKAEIQFAARRPGDPPILVAQADAAKRDLMLSFKSSNLKTILETAIRWEKKQFSKKGGRHASL